MFYYSFPGNTSSFGIDVELPELSKSVELTLPVKVPFTLNGAERALYAKDASEAYWVATIVAIYFDVNINHVTECGKEIRIDSIVEQMRYLKYAPPLSQEYEHLKMLFINNLGYVPVWFIPMVLNRKAGAKTYANWDLNFEDLIQRDLEVLDRVRPGAGAVFPYREISRLAFINC